MQDAARVIARCNTTQRHLILPRAAPLLYALTPDDDDDDPPPGPSSVFYVAYGYH